MDFIKPPQTRPFNIQHAQSGAPCGNAAGTPVCLHTFTGNAPGFPIIGHFEGETGMINWTTEGHQFVFDGIVGRHGNDLVMFPVMNFGGVNLFHDDLLERRIPMTEQWEKVMVGAPAYEGGPNHAMLLAENGIYENGILRYRVAQTAEEKILEEIAHDFRTVSSTTADDKFNLSEALESILMPIVMHSMLKRHHGDFSQAAKEDPAAEGKNARHLSDTQVEELLKSIFPNSKVTKLH